MPIKLRDPDAIVEYVWSKDPAISDESDVDGYLETGDVSKLKAKDGDKLTIWKLKRLPIPLQEKVCALMYADNRDPVQAFRDKQEAFREAVAAGVVGCSEFDVSDPARFYDLSLFSELTGQILKLATVDPL